MGRWGIIKPTSQRTKMIQLLRLTFTIFSLATRELKSEAKNTVVPTTHSYIQTVGESAKYDWGPRKLS